MKFKFRKIKSHKIIFLFIFSIFASINISAMTLESSSEEETSVKKTSKKQLIKDFAKIKKIASGEIKYHEDKQGGKIKISKKFVDLCRYLSEYKKPKNDIQKIVINYLRKKYPKNYLVILKNIREEASSLGIKLFSNIKLKFKVLITEEDLELPEKLLLKKMKKGIGKLNVVDGSVYPEESTSEESFIEFGPVKYPEEKLTAFYIEDFIKNIREQSLEEVEEFAELLSKKFDYEMKRKVVGELIEILNPRNASKILKKIDKCRKKIFKNPENSRKILKLKNLNISSKQLALLIPLIENCKRLKKLKLYKNEKLKEIPKNIGNLVRLEWLQLHNNELKKLPESIGKLKNLKLLDLYNNQLNKLPKGIGNLTKLEWLGLSNNKLTELPKTIGKLGNLENLKLSKNQLRELPSTIGNLKNLRHFELNHNKLKGLPESIGKLINLRNLYLVHNKLKELTPTIGNLENLKFLHVSNNKLRKLPPTIGFLEKLIGLYLSNNELTEIPESILGLPNLNGIWIENNPLNTKSLKILKNLEEHGVGLY
ncbi:hypothetical protein GF385_01005 [Candidatus Dependentiae bacterium]|nr:hypothetical protein [Candidatus Dependentiae bacterium]